MDLGQTSCREILKIWDPWTMDTIDLIYHGCYIKRPNFRFVLSDLTCYSIFMEDTNQYDALIGDGRAGVEAPSCKRGVHVRTCRCTPHLTCVNLLSNGSLAAHQVQTQSAQQFARYGKRACTCARADATHPDLCKARIYWAPSHTQNLNAILPVVCEIWKRGVHVRTCRCTPPQTCRKHLSNGPLVTHKI